MRCISSTNEVDETGTYYNIQSEARKKNTNTVY